MKIPLLRTAAPVTSAAPDLPSWSLRGLLGLLVGVLLIRLSLLWAGGALSFPDEERYLESIAAAQLLLAGKLETAALHLANTQGRPADALLRLPIAFVQVFWHRLGGPSPEAPASLLLPQLMNWVVLLGNVTLLYRLGRRWLPPLSALVACLLYSALVSTNVYVRHVLPYDMALLVLLAALVLLTGRQMPSNVRDTSFLTGLLSCLLVMIYPGYYFAPVLLGLVLLAALPCPSWLRGLLWAALGATVILLPLEVLTRFGHISYLRTLQTLAPTITQGDYQEGFTFSGKYLWQIEGPLGVVLGLLALPGIRVLVRRSGSNGAVLRMLGLAPLGLWLLHATLVFGAHTFVFYGRILHCFLPFLVLYAVTALAALPVRARRISQAVAVGLGVVSFCFFLRDYLPLAYPRDVLARFEVQPTDQLTYQNESAVGHLLNFHPVQSLTRPVPSVASSLYLINFTFLYPLPLTACAPLPAPAGAQLLYQGTHFLTFPAYGFEGFTPAERHHFRACNFQCRVYKK